MTTIFEDIEVRAEYNKLHPQTDSRYDLEKDREYLIELCKELLAENELVKGLASTQAGFES